MTFALPDESRVFRKLLTGVRETRSEQGALIIGTLHGVEVAIAHIGVGQVAAERGIAALLEEVRPELLICAGYGGALDPALRIGDVVMDRPPADLHVHPPTCARIGAIHTSREAAESVEAKRALHLSTGAQVVDMETAAVCAACTAIGVPALAVRVISDEATQPLPVPMEHWFNLEAQRPRPIALVAYLVRRPRAIAPFARFVAGLSGARARLAGALSEIIAQLASRPPAQGVRPSSP